MLRVAKGCVISMGRVYNIEDVVPPGIFYFKTLARCLADGRIVDDAPAVDAVVKPKKRRRRKKKILVEDTNETS